MAEDAEDLDAELERYAELVVMLVEPTADRVAILGRAGLDEESWAGYEASWQARLRRDEVRADAKGQIPPLWLAFSQALQQAQERSTKGLLKLEPYAKIARVLARGGDVSEALQAQGVTMVDFLRAHSHWIKRATSDDALAAKLQELLT